MSILQPYIIHPVPAFADNYLWVMHDGAHAIVVDPGDATPVIDYLTANSLTLDAILITHHHPDHVGGVAALLDFLPGGKLITVYGPATETIPRRKVALREGDIVTVLGAEFRVIDVPGHTDGHIAYYAAAHGILFCGDTLFACGCGRLFEGTPQQMQSSLAKLAALPGETKVYCTHEYTMSNIRFALSVEPDNAALQSRAMRDDLTRKQNQPTVPSTIALERETNPFLRWAEPDVITKAKLHSGSGVPAISASIAAPELVFAAIRKMKDNFK